MHKEYASSKLTEAFRKFLPFVLLVAAAACGPPHENPATQMSQKIREWVPAGTSLAGARQIMVQHQFACSVNSYNSKAEMPNKPSTMRWETGIIVNGRNVPVTNISELNCKGTNDGSSYDVTLTAINNQIDGAITVISHAASP